EVGELSAPLPFLAPPIYFHAALVVEVVAGKRTKISKRDSFMPDEDEENLNPRFFIDSARRRFFRLPETIVSYLLSSIIPYPRDISLRQHRRMLGELAGEVGCQTLIDIAASTVSLNWFDRSRTEIVASEEDLAKQERHVLKKLIYYQFLRRIR